jgi:P pilus assembly chaperone PapD
LLVAGLLAISGPVAAGAPVAQQTADVPASSVPNINITPRRVLLNPRKRSEALFVFNQGSSPITVDVTLVDNVMLPSGEIVPLEEARKRGGTAMVLADRVSSAREGMIVAPSRLLLAPGKGRTVRLQAPPTSPAAAAETRTHLTITTVPPPSAGLTAEEAAEAARRGELSFNIQTIFGISIPVIVRSGAVASQVSLGPMELESETGQGAERNPVPVLVIPINRSGNKSVYGNLEVRAGKGKASEVIGLARGLGVYPEIDQRIVRLSLSRVPRPGEKLSVTYYDDEDASSEGTLASGELIVK